MSDIHLSQKIWCFSSRKLLDIHRSCRPSGIFHSPKHKMAICRELNTNRKKLKVLCLTDVKPASWLMDIQSWLYCKIILHPEIMSTKLSKLGFDTTLQSHHCKNVIPRSSYSVGIILPIHHNEDESTMQNNWKRAMGASKHTENRRKLWKLLCRFRLTLGLNTIQQLTRTHWT